MTRWQTYCVMWAASLLCVAHALPLLGADPERYRGALGGFLVAAAVLNTFSGWRGRDDRP